VRESRERLREVTTALTQGVLVASGLVAVVVLGLNCAFVRWWVGPQQFGGGLLTALFVLLMVLRHWGVTLAYTAYSFGHERATALIGAGEGVMAVSVTLLLVPRLGIVGGALGGLAGASLVSLPLVLRVVARDVGEGGGRLLLPLLPWAWRCALLAGVAVGVSRFWAPRNIVTLAAAGLAFTVLYAVLMRSVALRAPLQAYVTRTLESALPRLARLPVFRPPS
jgi:O-antigen/teichoic acid export membrane protein